MKLGQILQPDLTIEILGPNNIDRENQYFFLVQQFAMVGPNGAPLPFLGALVLADGGLVIRAWKAPGETPAHQFAETAPLSPSDPGPVLWVGRGPLPARDRIYFSFVGDMGDRSIAPASTTPLPLRFMRLDGFDPDRDCAPPASAAPAVSD